MMATDPTQIFNATGADPLAQVQTMAGAPAAQAPGLARPNFGQYIPQGLVQMLLRLQARRPEMFAQRLNTGMADRFGLTPETDLANLYTRQMARQDFRGGTDPMAAGTILTPEQRTGYPAMRQWPDYAGGIGNNAPAQPGGQGVAPGEPNPQRTFGMAARRQSPGGGY